MKKTKFIALVLVVAIGLMGAGYAAWTESFTVNNSMSSGQLKIELSKANASSEVDFNSQAVKAADLIDNLVVADTEIKGNVAKFAIDNMYPGTQFITSLRAENKGTLPAVINEITVNTVAKDARGKKITNSKLQEAIRVDYEFVIRQKGSHRARKTIEGNDVSLAELKTVLSQQLIGQYIGADEELTRKSEDERLGYNVTFKIPQDGLNNVNGKNEGENEKVEVEIIFDFVQHNVFDKTFQQ
ncbi:hypothetical protein CACET_c08950 [Clostridium aceticum]|uniref:Uncharacterized protein n=1 Tax=Clostridium aceticum TaxID=84022 RepID=A0A0D8IDJ8_9CLOT|nr:hypothetical protein [Clostridium aceticum]AKL94403.1 hypothetical protein CACET_c08950 [Clostridium aceticum]KJF28370.1 hypothetical protein TZ02_03120 [Clostridium aceticum]